MTTVGAQIRELTDVASGLSFVRSSQHSDPDETIVRQRLGGQDMTKKIVLFAAMAAAVVGLAATPASATHPHHLDTPGTCVDRNGAGFGTGQVHTDNTADPGDTTFHERIHKGVPGLYAFERTGQVSVAGGFCG